MLQSLFKSANNGLGLARTTCLRFRSRAGGTLASSGDLLVADGAHEEQIRTGSVGYSVRSDNSFS